eukprot:scaffold39672_cov32-Phaeocystis_antarctica.AAC.1
MASGHTSTWIRLMRIATLPPPPTSSSRALPATKTRYRSLTWSSPPASPPSASPSPSSPTVLSALLISRYFTIDEHALAESRRTLYRVGVGVRGR